MSVHHSEDHGHLPERSLLTTSEGRVICKGPVDAIVRKPKNSQMLCRRLYDQRNYGQSQCRFSTNRRPQEDAAKTQDTALNRARSYRTNPWITGKPLTQRRTSTKEHPWPVEPRRKTRQSEDSRTAASGDPLKASNVFAAYKLWRDANGYGKQNARWGRSSKNRSWTRDRRETTQHRRNGATEEDLIFGGSSHERREISNSTGRMMHWIIKDHPELNALMVSDLASGLGDAAGGKPNVNGNAIRRKRTHLQGPVRISPEIKEVLEEYLDWRSKNGYGKLAGRWG